MKGPRVSGTWLDSWGGNTKASQPQVLYSLVLIISSVWDYVPVELFLFAGQVAAS